MRKSIRIFQYITIALLAVITSTAFSQTHFPRGTHDVFITKSYEIRANLLQNIAPVIEKSIQEGYYPGAVVLIGHKGKIIYRGVFGNRRIVPDIAPMQFNTIFDIASLTKVVATTPAIMQLVEQGKFDLDAPVAKYWPAFAKGGKNNITIRQLLTHTSGLPPEIKHQENIPNENDLLEKISELNIRPASQKTFIYSDVNFIILAHLIKIISGERIDQYTKNHIYKPLGMTNTQFVPPAKLRHRIAPTELINGHLRWGQAQDPTAYAMGGISGHAGLFSNANDLGIYAQSLLNGGKILDKQSNKKNRQHHFLGPLAIAKMTTPQTPDYIAETRGLGWDIDSPFSNRGVLLPLYSYGHSGWTGTSIWIDPATKTWIVILTSRAHPKPAKSNQLIQDRRTIANIVSASLIDVHDVSLNNTGRGEIKRAFAK